MSRGSKGRLAFVTPRYGEEIVGGAETAMAEAARGLAERGYEIELLTTCATSHVSWANVHEAGEFVDRGVTVRRFRTAAARNRLVAAELEARVQRDERLSPEDELAWVNGRFRVPELYLYLGTHAQSYDAIIFAPYLFWSTIYGAAVAPERSIVMPCLHDEPYARLAVVRSMLESVGGVWFLTDPEHQLGHRIAPGLPPHHAVVGSGVAVPQHYDAAGFRTRHKLARPFVLYAGRREGGKGWPALLAAFGSAVVGGTMPFDLVTVGSGAAEIPEGLRSRVIDLGFLEVDELPNAYAAAEALLQPSTNESFSRSIMESWLAGTPVIANAAGEVLAWQCERSGGGLTYSDELEFAHCLRFLAEAPKAAEALAAHGREYVLEHYTWDTVLDEMERSLAAFAARPAMTRVLVVGTLPPPGGAAARDLAALAAQRAERGDVVELLSPDPGSAAHRNARLGGLLLAARLAWLSRRFDALILRIEEGVPCGSDTSRLARGLWLLALGAATSRFAEVTLRLDTPVPLPGGVGGRATTRLWASAQEIVVSDEADRQLLLVAPGVRAERVLVATPSVVRGESAPIWPEATDPALASSVLEVVRSRAAADRAALAARTLIVGVGADRASVTTAARRSSGAQALGIARLVAARLWRKTRRSIGLARA